MMESSPELPGFSIIVPTYQRRDLVCDCLEAIAELDYPGSVEVIVIIDGSTDGTRTAIEALQIPIMLRIVEQPNGGLASARNAGAAIATGDVLLFLDDDMLCRRDLLTQHASSYREGADAVVGEIPIEGGSPSGFLTEGIGAWAEMSAQEAREREILTPFNIFGGQMSVRRAVFEQLGGFDTAFTRDGGYGKEDADFGARLLKSHCVVHNPQAVSSHRYIVTPGEYLRRGYLLGRADVRFANRHLALSEALFERNGQSRWRTRLVLRPLAAIPGLRHLIAASARMAATALLATPARSSRIFGWLFHGARQVN